MAHDATNPPVASLDAAEARLRTLEARRATAGASCSSTEPAKREKALRLNAKLKGQIARAKTTRDRLKAAARAAARSAGRAGDDKAVDWPTATQAFLNDLRDRLAWAPAPLPPAVLALKAHIFRDQDEFAEFLDDNTIADPAGSVSRQDLRRLAEAHFRQMNRAAEMRLAAAMKARRYEAVGADSLSRRWLGLSVRPGAAAFLGVSRLRVTTVAATLRLVVPQATPHASPASNVTRAPTLGMGATREEWDAAFADDFGDLTDPCSQDPEETAARWAAYEAMGAP